MKTLGERSKEQRKKIKLTQIQLSKKVGVSGVTISQWESGDTSPKGENLYKLAKALQCSPDWLMFGDSNQTTKEPAAEWAGPMEIWDNDTPLNHDEVEIPFYVDVELAAGHGITEAHEYSGPKLRFAKSTLKKSSVNPAYAACVKVTGNSMEPIIPDGTTVGIDGAQTNIIDGKMYAINHDGMLRVKTLYKLPGNGLRVRSFNNDEYPDERYEAEELKHITIIGKVFWYSVLI